MHCFFFVDIYRKVKTGQRPYFRPTLHSSDESGLDDEMANMIRKCWSEDPIERPDFQSLKTIIRKINKYGCFLFAISNYKTQCFVVSD